MGLKATTRLVLIAPVLLALVGCAELNTLRERTAMQDKTISRLQKENSEFQSAYYKIKETMDAEHSQSEKTSGQLQRDLQEAKTQQSKREKELSDQLRTRNLEFEALKSESADQRTQLETKVAQLQHDLQAMQAERDAALVKLKETDDKLRAELAHTVDLTQQLAALKVDVQTLNDRVAGLQKEATERDAALKTEKDARAAAEKQVADLGKAVSDQKTAIQQAQDQAAQVKKQLDEAQAAAAKEKEGLSAQVSELKTKHSKEIEEVRKTASASAADDPELKAAAEQLNQKLKGMPNSAGAQARVDRRGMRIIIPDSMLFDPNGVILADRASGVLAAVAEGLKQAAGRPVRVEGHTDNQPVKDLPFADNWGLGYARADRVRDFLMKEGGVSGGRLTALSRAQFDPLDSNDTPEGRARNRRVEIVVGAKSEK